MTSRLGIELREDCIEWAVLHRVLRGPMQLATGSLAASVGVDDRGRLIAGPDASRPGVRDRVDRLPARLGDATPLIVGGVPYGAERLLAAVIAAAIDAGTRAAHDAPLHTVLVHPDGLDELRRGLLREAARSAGIAATSSAASTSAAAAALARVPVGGAGHGASVAAAQLAWERRPDDDHVAAALGSAGGAATAGGAAVLGIDRSAASAPSPTAGPTGTPIPPPAAGPTGTPIAPPAAGPTGTPIAPSAAGPTGTPLTPPAPVIATADHEQPRRKRAARARNRIVAAAAGVMVVAGTGIGIIAASGDDAATAPVVTTAEAAIDTVATTSAAPAATDETVTATEPEVTIIVPAEPPATEVAAPGAAAAPSAPGTVVAAPGAPATTTGWTIADVEVTGSYERHFDAVSCASELGPWHIVETMSVDGLISADVSFDVALGPDLAGTATGSERSSWTGGLEVTGTSAGTANLASQSTGGYLLFIDYDEDVQIVDPVGGDETQHNHHTLELHVRPAPAGVCP